MHLHEQYILQPTQSNPGIENKNLQRLKNGSEE